MTSTFLNLSLQNVDQNFNRREISGHNSDKELQLSYQPKTLILALNWIKLTSITNSPFNSLQNNHLENKS